MAVKGGPKDPGSGRVAGTPNKLTQSVQDFIEAILTQPEAEAYAKEFLELRGKNTGDAVRVFMRLLEYRFGSPKQPVELGVDSALLETLMRGRERAGDK